MQRLWKVFLTACKLAVLASPVVITPYLNEANATGGGGSGSDNCQCSIYNNLAYTFGSSDKYIGTVTNGGWINSDAPDYSCPSRDTERLTWASICVYYFPNQANDVISVSNATSASDDQYDVCHMSGVTVQCGCNPDPVYGEENLNCN